MYIRNSHIRTSFSLYFLQLADRNSIIVKRSFYFYLNARRLLLDSILGSSILCCSSILLWSGHIQFCIVLLFVFKLLLYFIQLYSYSILLSIAKFLFQNCISIEHDLHFYSSDIP